MRHTPYLVDDDISAKQNPHIDGVVVDVRRAPVQMEWPTVFVVLTCWGCFVGLLVVHRQLPDLVVVALFALLGGWYMSVQHEVLHGHPTPWRWLNVTIAFPPLSLWLPYRVYRDSHLLHHRSELSMPGLDPESFYVDAATWDRSPRWWRLVLRANRTFVGRLTIGPATFPQGLVRWELSLARRDASLRRMWLVHVVGVSVIAWVVFIVAGVPVWQYLLGYCYLGMSVTYIRSFVEHQAIADPAMRSAVVTSGWFFGILFLFNNLHHTHHALPGAPWYRLPRLTEEMGAEAIAASGAGWYRGYAEIMRRHAFRPFSTVVSPLVETNDRR